MSKARTEPLRPEHFELIDPQENQPMSLENIKILKESGETLDHLMEYGSTGFYGDQILGCSGVIKVWPKRAYAWAILDKSSAGSNMIWVHDWVSSFLDSHQPDPFTRVEMSVLQSFRQAHRWAKMLGFISEGIMRCYDQYGQDYSMYARIRK